MFHLTTTQTVLCSIALSLVLCSSCATVSEESIRTPHYKVDAAIPPQAVATQDLTQYPSPEESPVDSVDFTNPHTSNDPPSAPPMPFPEDLIPPAKAVEPPPALANQQESCLPEFEKWKSEFEKKSELTDNKLNKLQAALDSSQEQIERMQSEQANSKAEIDRLKEKVNFYRREVARLEQLMETQHAADLVILDSLTNQLGGLLQSTRSRQIQ